MAEWYYIGHYGQLGPLTGEQIEELVQGGVIARETYVWRTGMGAWQSAGDLAELEEAFKRAEPFFASPPPPPGASLRPPPPSSPATTAAPPYGTDIAYSYGGYMPSYPTLKSDRSRALAGVLQLIVPGVGRIYLGYAAYGVLQLVLSLCMVGWIWSIVDGILILTGGVRVDGYGRQLAE